MSKPLFRFLLLPALLVFLLSSIDAFAQPKTRTYIADQHWWQRDRNVDYTHLRLTVSFDAPAGSVKGNVTHVFTVLRQQIDSIRLDGIQMRYATVRLGGKEAKYRADSAGITVFVHSPLKLGMKDSIHIVYECNPRKGIHFIGWNDPKNLSRKQIWTQGQGIDNRHWIPVYDERNEKVLSDVTVTFDKEYKVLSNGTRTLERANADGTKTWRYKMTQPHAPYLIMLGIGQYNIETRKSKSGVPLYLYYYPEWKDRVALTYRESEDMVDFFEREYGVKYPWASYAQIPVQDFMYGAMENTMATVFGDFFMVDSLSTNDRYYLGVNAHELAHQWFGDYVTARSDAHHWLQESFATYGNMLYERKANGDEFFDWARRSAQNASLEESKKNLFGIAHSEAGSVRHYPKGAVVLNMLKYVVGGDAVYNKCIKNFLERHPYGLVDSHDLLVAFEETSGMALGWFWEQWVYKGGEPAYNVTWQQESNGSVFTVTQTHELNALVGQPESLDAVSPRPAGLWRMPFWFEVHYTDGTVDRKQAWIENQSHEVRFDNPGAKQVSFVLFDPDNMVMKSAMFTKPFAMLKAQALNAEHMLDRFDALVAMRDVGVDEKRDVLIQAFGKEKSSPVKNEAIAQLINDNDAKSIALVKQALSDTDVSVQKNVLSNTKAIRPELMSDYENLLNARSYELIASALEKLIKENPDKRQQYLDRVKHIEGTSGKNVRIKWLELAAATDPSVLNELVEYTSLSYEFRTRLNAMAALRRLNHFDDAAALNTIDALMSSNGRLSGGARETIQHFYKKPEFKSRIDGLVAAQQWEGWQRIKLSGALK